MCSIASSVRGDIECVIEEERTRGGRHIVRIVKFEDGVRWIARAATHNINASENTNSDQLSWANAEDARSDLDEDKVVREVIASQLELADVNIPQHAPTSDNALQGDEPSLADVTVSITHDPMQAEVDTLQLVRERTTIPVPAVHRYHESDYFKVGAAFMLMEAVDGNMGYDAGSWDIPKQYKPKFLDQLAKIQVSDFVRCS